MQIDFIKIKQSPIDINYSKDNTKIVGTLERINKDCVKLDSEFSSKIELICNRCGKEFVKDFDYALTLLLADGVYSDKSELDIIEFHNKTIDFDYISFSEIASIQEDYNYCKECQNSDETLEYEF
jgi:uncharacterized metal-binding protein YceD (DUF177 family)